MKRYSSLFKLAALGLMVSNLSGCLATAAATTAAVGYEVHKHNKNNEPTTAPVVNKDGSTTVTNKDGSITTTSKNGLVVTTVSKDGNTTTVKTTHKDGTVTTVTTQNTPAPNKNSSNTTSKS